MKKKQISIGSDELRILKENYNIDLTKPNSSREFPGVPLEVRQELYKLKREVFNSAHPHRKKRIPNGPKCSFCLKAKNEVPAMATHESGFNLCNRCLKVIQRFGRD